MAMRSAPESGGGPSVRRSRAFVRRSISRLLSRADVEETLALEGTGAHKFDIKYKEKFYEHINLDNLSVYKI